MESGLKRLRLKPRLAAAADMLSGLGTIADVGCDHGRLACALLQSGAAGRCIAIDCSTASIEKCARLAALVGVSDRLELRLGDGLLPLVPGEADGVALLGLGSALIVRLLERSAVPLAGAKLGVFSPMRAADELRCYLWNAGYHVLDDRVVEDAGRLYQVFCVSPPDGQGRDELPDGFPRDCFSVGYEAFRRGGPLFTRLVRRQLDELERRLRTARLSAGEARLKHRAQNLLRILEWTEARA